MDSVSGVEHTEVIDLVGRDADGTLVLIMIEPRPWGADPLQHEQLKQKINNYAGYILDGGPQQWDGWTEDSPTRIQLSCLEPPDDLAVGIVEYGNRVLAPIGVAITIRVLPTSTDPQSR